MNRDPQKTVEPDPIRFQRTTDEILIVRPDDPVISDELSTMARMDFMLKKLIIEHPSEPSDYSPVFRVLDWLKNKWAISANWDKEPF